VLLSALSLSSRLWLSWCTAGLVAVDLRGLVCQPMFDPVSHLVYVAGREHVTHVWVDGKLKLNDRRLVDLEPDDLIARAAYWRGKLTA